MNDDSSIRKGHGLKKTASRSKDMNRSIRQNLTDEESLGQLGHQQELRRTFSLPALGALCLCLMAAWEALSTVIAPALISGGPPCLFYN